MTSEITRAAGAPWALISHEPAGAREAQATDVIRHKLDLASLLRLLLEWRWLILGLAALGLAGGALLTLLTTPLYRSDATLEANPPSVQILDEKSNARSQAPDSWNFISTQVGLLSSRSLARRVAEDLELASSAELVDQSLDPKTRLQLVTSAVAQGLKVKAPEEGQLIGISFVAESPVLAARVVNGIADNFIRSNLERRYEASAFARTFLERQIAKTRVDLEQSERQLVGYAQSQGIINTGAEAGASSGDVGSLQGSSLVALNSALAEATSRRIAAEGAYRAQSNVITSETNASTQALRQAKALLEGEYQQKRTLMKPEHPEMLSLRSRVDELNRQIRLETAQIVGGRSNQLLSEYQAAASAERALRSRVSSLKNSVLNLRGRSIQYTILQREVDTNRALFDALLQRYKEIGVAGGIGNNLISIVDRGEVPAAPYSPRLGLNLLIGLVLGSIAGLGLAVALEFINDSVKSREDIRQKLSIACLGVIPKSGGTGSLTEDLNNPSTAVSEAYAAVTGALRYATEAGTPKSLLISSTQPNEGKSSTALALARNFARLGGDVLLVDADLRKPTFKAADSQRGLTPLLTTDTPIDQHIFATQFDGLSLLPCGPVPVNPADLLASARFSAVLAEASNKFDFVVVDGPPVLGLADSPTLASYCIGTLIVIEAGRTKTTAIRAALNRLDASGARVIGGLLTKADERAGAYGYGYDLYRYGGGASQSEILMMPGKGS